MIQDEPKGSPKGAQREPKGLEMGQGGGSRGSKITKSVYFKIMLKPIVFIAKIDIERSVLSSKCFMLAH